MEEQWRVLGARAILPLNDAWKEPLGRSFDHATARLGLRAFQIGLLAGGHAVPWESIDLLGATANLGESARTIARCNELHNRVVRVYSIYGHHLGVLTDGPLWQDNLALHAAADPRWHSWVQHRAHALQRAIQASQRLRTVAAYDLVTVDALTLARSSAVPSADRDAWMRAAANLAAVRQEEASAALLDNTTQMADAISGLLSDGFAILLA